jgi:hypothetical protein
MNILSKDFWSYAGERAIKTIAQAALATIAASELIGIFAVDWTAVFSVAALAGVASVLTSIAFPTVKEEKETE